MPMRTSAASDSAHCNRSIPTAGAALVETDEIMKLVRIAGENGGNSLRFFRAAV